MLTFFIECKIFIFQNIITKILWSSKFWQKSFQDEVIFSFTATPPKITTDAHTGEQIYSTYSSNS